jgi:ferritin
MIAAKVQDALNKHVTSELFSSNLYLAMSAWCEANAYKGFGRWLRVQAEEERTHSLKILDFILARGGQARLGAVDAPGGGWKSVLEVFKAVQAHERKVSESIDSLHAAAVAQKDTATQVFLQWFVSEQVEEESLAAEIVDKLTLIGDKPATILYLDKEYGKRGKAS